MANISIAALQQAAMLVILLTLGVIMATVNVFPYITAYVAPTRTGTAIGYYRYGKCVLSLVPRLNDYKMPTLTDCLAILNGKGIVLA